MSIYDEVMADHGIPDDATDTEYRDGAELMANTIVKLRDRLAAVEREIKIAKVCNDSQAETIERLVLEKQEASLRAVQFSDTVHAVTARAERAEQALAALTGDEAVEAAYNAWVRHDAGRLRSLREMAVDMLTAARDAAHTGGEHG